MLGPGAQPTGVATPRTGVRRGRCVDAPGMGLSGQGPSLPGGPPPGIHDPALLVDPARLYRLRSKFWRRWYLEHIRRRITNHR